MPKKKTEASTKQIKRFGVCIEQIVIATVDVYAYDIQQAEAIARQSIIDAGGTVGKTIGFKEGFYGNTTGSKV